MINEKLAVIPLHKGKGLLQHEPNSYRPITLLPVISKLVERSVQEQIVRFMEPVISKLVERSVQEQIVRFMEPVISKLVERSVQ